LSGFENPDKKNYFENPKNKRGDNFSKMDKNFCPKLINT
jgi:hypothetical protein